MWDPPRGAAQNPRKPAATAGTTVSNPNAGSTRKTRGKSSRTGTVRARASARRRRSRRDSAARRASESLTAAPSRAPVASTVVSGRGADHAAPRWPARSRTTHRAGTSRAPPRTTRRPSAAPTARPSRPLRTASTPRSPPPRGDRRRGKLARQLIVAPAPPRHPPSNRPAPGRRAEPPQRAISRGDRGRAGGARVGRSARGIVRSPRARSDAPTAPSTSRCAATSTSAPQPSASTGIVGVGTSGLLPQEAADPERRERFEREPGAEAQPPEAGVGEHPHLTGIEHCARAEVGDRQAADDDRRQPGLCRSARPSAAISERSRSDDARPSSASAARPPVVAATASAPAALFTPGRARSRRPRRERVVERRTERAPAVDARELGGEQARRRRPSVSSAPVTVPPVRSSPRPARARPAARPRDAARHGAARAYEADRPADEHDADRDRREHEIEPARQAARRQRGEQPDLHRGARRRRDVGRDQRGLEPLAHDARQRGSRRAERTHPIGRLDAARRAERARPLSAAPRRRPATSWARRRRRPASAAVTRPTAGPRSTPARRAGRVGRATATSTPPRRSNSVRTPRRGTPTVGTQLGDRVDRARAVGRRGDEHDGVERGRDLMPHRGERQRDARRAARASPAGSARRPGRWRARSRASRRGRC